MKHNNPFGEAIKKVIKKNQLLAGGMALLIIASILFSLFPPLVLEKIIDFLTGQRKTSVYLVVLYFAALVLSGLLESAQNILITAFGQKITHGLREHMCAKLSRLPASYFISHEAGKITSRFVNDVDAVDSLFSSGIISMFADACKVISILAVIFWKNRGLGLLLLLILPLLFCLTRIFQKRMLKAQMENRTAVEKVNNHIPETIRNIRMIHTLFRQNYMEQRYDDYIQESYRAVEKSNLYDSVYSPIVIFTSSCVTALMMVLAASGGRMQSFFGMSVGTAVAVTAYVGKVFTPLESIGMEIQNIQSAAAGVRRINEFLAETEEEAVKDGREASPNAEEGEIRLQHVTFGYEEGKPILEDFSFHLKAGEHTTLTGRTGMGKSTILRLLLGLYTPQKGEISISGLRPQEIGQERKRKVFGYVEQSFRLVSGTAAEQISLFDASITREQIEEAAALTGLHEVILALPQGYDTPVTENTFSQGQLQLLSIARAVVADPQILLLDEITANLDADTERRMMEALERVSGKCTMLSVSHRV